MRKSAILAGLYLVSATMIFNVVPAHAISFEESIETELKVSKLNIADSKVSIFSSNNQPDKKPDKKPAAKISKPIKHVVKRGETLSKIATSHKVKWQSIYDKNRSIESPDQINIGDVLIIPAVNEKLKKRSAPKVKKTEEAQPASTTQSPTANNVPSATQAGSSAGNTYYYGYCTFYAKSRRPDLPNNLGNADTWVSSAASQGFATGSTPRVGAIGQQGMHVVYVESVNKGGTVTVSEMNYNGWGVVSSRTVSASTFMYIY